MTEEPNCEITVDGKKYKIRANTIADLMDWAKKKGIPDVKINKMTFYIPEIKKHIHMVAKFRPDIQHEFREQWKATSTDGMVLYSTTTLTPEEAEIIKKTHPELGKLFAFI